MATKWKKICLNKRKSRLNPSRNKDRKKKIDVGKLNARRYEYKGKKRMEKCTLYLRSQHLLNSAKISQNSFIKLDLKLISKNKLHL